MISICVISNQPYTLMEMIKTINSSTMPFQSQIELCISHQFHGMDLPSTFEQLCFDRNIRLKKEPTPSPYKDKDGRFNYAMARVHSVSMATNPYILIADSDFEFQSKAGSMNYSSGDRIRDGIEFLDANPTAGIIRLSSAFGGYHFGRDFVEFKSSCASTDRGLLLRNDPSTALIIPEMIVAGVGEDVAIILTKFIQGYNAYKGFNSITNKPVGKQFGKGYNIEIEREGLLGTINELYPKFVIKTEYGRKRLHPKEWEQLFGEPK